MIVFQVKGLSHRLSTLKDKEKDVIKFFLHIAPSTPKTQRRSTWIGHVSLSIGDLYSVASMTSSGTAFEILPHLQCTWLAVTLKSTSFSAAKQSKLQATCASGFACKHIVDNTYDISRGIGITKASDSKRCLQCHSMSLLMASFERPHPHTISY